MYSLRHSKCSLFASTGWRIRPFSPSPWKILFSLALFAFPMVVEAASTWKPGEPVGEPLGASKEILVLHETLHINMTPLDSNRPITITVRYSLENKKKTQKLRLHFLRNDPTGAVVSLNGNKIRCEEAKPTHIPRVWRLPESSKVRGLLYPEKKHGFKCGLVVPKGRHHLVVRYNASLGQHHPTYRMYRDYIFGYILSPARQWGYLGMLDIFVKVQQGWELSSSLPLTKRGTIWSGGFVGIPADAMILRVQQTSTPLPFGFFFSALGFLLSLGFTTWLFTFHAGRTTHLGWARVWPFLGHALGAALVSAGLVWCGAHLEQYLLDTSQLSTSWTAAQLTPRSLLFYGSIPATIVVGLFIYLSKTKARKRESS